MRVDAAINLHYKKSGKGPELIILHGLFGNLDNWQTITKILGSHFTVFAVDLRNHGKSPHTEDISYPLMAYDVLKFIKSHQMKAVNILGHSMGGKVILEMLNQEPQCIHKAIILDIAPKKYEPGHHSIFSAMFSLNLSSLKSRNEADEQIKNLIPEYGVRQFILKNLERDKHGNFSWKINLNTIFNFYAELNKEISFKNSIDNHVLFIKGGLSKYINSEDERHIPQILPKAQFIEIKDAGHWVHADKPEELVKIVVQYLFEFDNSNYNV